MARLTWGDVGQRYYETGLDRGVLYVDANSGVPWNGLTSVTESPSGGESRPYYLDGAKYMNIAAVDEYEASIQAFSSPPEFDVCDGNAVLYSGLVATNQRRKSFGLCYRTFLGNDVDGVNHAYKIHLVYNALASPTQHNNATIGSSTEPLDLSWAITTTPPITNLYRPTAHLIIDSRSLSSGRLLALEDVLYGTIDTASRMPSQTELLAMFVDGAVLEILAIGANAYSAEGAEVVLLAANTFSIDHAVIVDNSNGSFTIL